jgi:hypothetical protein
MLVNNQSYLLHLLNKIYYMGRLMQLIYKFNKRLKKHKLTTLYLMIYLKNYKPMLEVVEDNYLEDRNKG